MKEKIRALLERRSIRSYKDTQITEEELSIILEAGQFAPSGMGDYKWKFVVVQRDGAMEKLLDEINQEFGLGENAFYHAPTLVIVFTDNNSCAPIEDGSLAIGNMLNASHIIGLGSCWIHVVPQFFKTDRGKKLQEEYSVPEGYSCVGSCAIGYSNISLPSPNPRKQDIIIRA